MSEAVQLAIPVKLKVTAWLAYRKDVKAAAVGEEWPPVPEPCWLAQICLLKLCISK